MCRARKGINMSESDRLPRRITWVVALTGVLSIICLSAIGLFNLSSILLIVGIVVQLWLYRLGRWLVWFGAAGLSLLVFGFDILLLRHPVPYHDRGTLLLAMSTCVLIWCDAELVIEAFARFRNRTHSPQPLNIYEWIFVTILNLWTLLAAAFIAVRGHHASGNPYGGVMFWGWLVFIVVADFSIIKNLRGKQV